MGRLIARHGFLHAYQITAEFLLALAGKTPKASLPEVPGWVWKLADAELDTEYGIGALATANSAELYFPTDGFEAGWLTLRVGDWIIWDEVLGVYQRCSAEQIERLERGERRERT